MLLDAGGGCMFFIFLIIIVVSIVSSAKKSKLTGGSGGGSLLDLQNALKDANFQSALTGGTRPQGTSYRKRRRPPINWRLIKMNMTKEQINECFDMAELRKGVKKEQLPNHVHLDRLKQYFSTAQLQDFIDLEFFEGAGETVDNFKRVSTLTPLGQKMRTSEEATRPQPKKAEPAVKPVRTKTRKKATRRAAEQLQREVVNEGTSFESVSESMEREAASDRFGREDAADRFNRESVNETMYRESHINAVSRIAKIAEQGEGPIAIRNAIIWKEILSPPPMVQAFKKRFSSSSIPTRN